ncbi:MAG: ParB/RepB/Spo0J family partition protein [Candidatus Aenigmarchaeota archaeon]|nr:ParB/RepB/Spo0J family partition protein [Candidatus Aenigmarchaeota archaeon]
MKLDNVKKISEFLPEFKRRIEIIELDNIEPNPINPRRKFSQEQEDELIESINSKGVLQPITVYEKKNKLGKFVILDGQRRFLASKKLNLKTVPAHIVTSEPSIIENLSMMFHIHNVHEDWTDLAVALSLEKILGELHINKTKLNKNNLRVIQKITSLSEYKIKKYVDILSYSKSVIEKFKDSEINDKMDLDIDILTELRTPIKMIQKVIPSILNKYPDYKIVDILINKKKDKIITTNKEIRKLSKILRNVEIGNINKQVALEKFRDFFENKNLTIEQIYSDTAETLEQTKIVIKSAEKISRDINNIDTRKIPKDNKLEFDVILEKLLRDIENIRKKLK